MNSRDSNTPPRILKHHTCPSLSGNSILSYHLGYDAVGEICFQLIGNTGSGKFNTDWVSLSGIEALIAKRPDCSTLSSATLRHLFQGKSTNSPSFLFAVLFAEEIVRAGPDRDSGYLLGDIQAYRQRVAVLTTESLDPPVSAAMSVNTPKPKRSGKEKA